MASIAQVTVRFGVDLKQFTTQMQKATKDIQAMGRQMQSTGRSLTRNLTAPILALGAASTKLAVDFDESMTKIQTLVGLSEDTVKGFRTEVLKLAGKTAQAPADLADALFTVTSAGLRGAEALQVLEMAAKGSAVGMGDTKEIARAVTAVMQAYGPETLNAAQAMDVLTATVREGNLEASELAPVLGRVVGIAAQLGVSFDEVGASIATFTRLGVDSSEAVTGLSGFLNGLLKPSQQGKDALNAVGTSFAELRKEIDQRGLAATMIKLLNTFEGNEEALAAVIPNVRALGAVMGTAGAQGQSYLQIQENIANSTGILNEAFEETSNSGAYKLKEAFNSLKQVGTDIGGIILPLVADLASGVKDLVQSFSNLPRETQINIVKFAALGALIGPMISTVGSLVVGFGRLLKSLRLLGTFLAANPWIALGTAIAGVVAYLWSYEEVTSEIEKTQSSATDKLKDEQAELNSLVTTITRLNKDNETRKALLEDLDKKYPDFLARLGNEETSNKNLQTALAQVNEEYRKKIALQAGQDDLTENLRQQKVAMDNMKALQVQLTELQDQAYKADSLQSQEAFQKKIDATNSAIDLNRIALENLREEYKETEKSYTDLVAAMGGAVPTPTTGTGGGALGTGQQRETFNGPDTAFSGTPLVTKIQQVNESIQEVTTSFGEFQEAGEETESIMSQAFTRLGSSITGVFEDMLTGAKVSIKGILNVITSLIAKLAAAAVAAAALSILLPGGGVGKLGQATSAVTGFSSLFKNFAGFRAAGGPVNAGSGYIVGENGPEYFQPSTSGTIIPNHALGGVGMGKLQVQIVGAARLHYDGTGLSALISQENIRIKKMGG